MQSAAESDKSSSTSPTPSTNPLFAQHIESIVAECKQIYALEKPTSFRQNFTNLDLWSPSVAWKCLLFLAIMHYALHEKFPHSSLNDPAVALVLGAMLLHSFHNQAHDLQKSKDLHYRELKKKLQIMVLETAINSKRTKTLVDFFEPLTKPMPFPALAITSSSSSPLTNLRQQLQGLENKNFLIATAKLALKSLRERPKKNQFDSKESVMPLVTFSPTSKQVICLKKLKKLCEDIATAEKENADLLHDATDPQTLSTALVKIALIAIPAFSHFYDNYNVVLSVIFGMTLNLGYHHYSYNKKRDYINNAYLKELADCLEKFSAATSALPLENQEATIQFLIELQNLLNSRLSPLQKTLKKLEQPEKAKKLIDGIRQKLASELPPPIKISPPIKTESNKEDKNSDKDKDKDKKCSPENPPSDKECHPENPLPEVIISKKFTSLPTSEKPTKRNPKEKPTKIIAKIRKAIINSDPETLKTLLPTAPETLNLDELVILAKKRTEHLKQQKKTITNSSEVESILREHQRKSHVELDKKNTTSASDKKQMLTPPPIISGPLEFDPKKALTTLTANIDQIYKTYQQQIMKKNPYYDEKTMPISAPELAPAVATSLSRGFEIMQLLELADAPSVAESKDFDTLSPVLLMVGGAPRDILLGKSSTKDIDFITNLNAKELRIKLTTLKILLSTPTNNINFITSLSLEQLLQNREALSLLLGKTIEDPEKDIDLATKLNLEQLLKKLKSLQEKLTAEQLKTLKKNQPSLKLAPVTVGTNTLFKITYEHNRQKYKLEILCDPNFSAKKKSLIENASRRNFNTNGIFINGRGEFPLTGEHITTLLEKTPKIAAYLKKYQLPTTPILPSDGHLRETPIDVLIPNWDSFIPELKLKSLNQKDVITAIKNLIADPKRIIHFFATLSTTDAENPILEFVLSSPLLDTIIKQALKNPLEARLANEFQRKFLSAIFDGHIAHHEASSTPKLSILVDNCTQSLIKVFSQPFNRNIMRQLFMSGGFDKTGPHLDKALEFLFPGEVKAKKTVSTIPAALAKPTEFKPGGKTFTMQNVLASSTIKVTPKPAITAQRDKFDTAMQEWLLKKYVRLNLIGHLHSFQEKIDLSKIDSDNLPLFPTTAEKILPLVFAAWWINCKRPLKKMSPTELYKEINATIKAVPAFEKFFLRFSDHNSLIATFCEGMPELISKALWRDPLYAPGSPALWTSPKTDAKPQETSATPKLDAPATKETVPENHSLAVEKS